MSELHWLTAAQAADAIRDRSLSPRELTAALLDRIDGHDGTLHALVAVPGERALAAACRAEEAVMRGEPLGPLHGIPYVLKDIIDAAGLPTTAHSKILAQNVAQADAEVTRRLEGAGAILIGKAATHEFALGGPSFDLPWPPARNPWDPRMAPGGSSSGSGVAVAAGFVPAAIGTDTGGSVRNPATMCGIVGMKATYGRVSRRGVFPLAFSLDHVGPLTRTVTDNALLLSVIAGHDPHDPGSAERHTPDFTADLDRGVRALRVGVVRHFYTRDLEASPEVVGAIERALGVLASLGAEVCEIATEPLQEFASCNRIIMLAEACAVHERWLKERPGDYGRLTRERLWPGLFLSAVDYVQATRTRSRLAAAFDQTMRTVDVALTASSMEPACPIEDAAAVERSYPRHARPPFNVTGHPALSVPVGFSKAGLPIAMQIVGRLFDEVTVYRVARAYERATPWHTMHPRLAAG